MLCAPAVGKDTVAEAVPLAGAPDPVKTAAVPDTVPEPSVVLPDLKVTVPVGPAPLLLVPMFAVKVTVWPIGTEFALLVMVAVVEAGVIEIAVAGEVLVVKLLSPE